MSDNILLAAALAAVLIAVCFKQEAPAAPINQDAPVSIYLPANAGSDSLSYEEAYIIAAERCYAEINSLGLDRTQDEVAIGINSSVDLDCFDMATF